MQLTHALYRHSVFVFGVFSALVLLGFWRYYSNPLALEPAGGSVSLVQLHGAGMTVWCLMLVSQAYLIRSGQRSLHRLMGKSSFVMVPVLVLLQLLVVRNAVSDSPGVVDAQGALTDFATVFTSLVLSSAALFGGIYAAAVYWRRNPAIHGRLMVGTAIPILPPATDRIINRYVPGVLNYVPDVHKSDALATFLVVDTLLIVLSVWDWRSRPRRVVFPLLLLLLLSVQVMVFNAHHLPLMRGFNQWFLGL